MNRLTKMSAILLASGMLLAGCSGSEGLERRKNKRHYLIRLLRTLEI